MAKTTKLICTFLLRFLALGATLSASIVMATSHQTTSILGMKFEAKYNTEPAFKYFVIMNAVGAIYSLLVLFLRSESLLRRFVLALDVIVAMLLASSISAALAIAHVGKKGNSHAGWLPICGQVPKFCDHVTGALISGFIGMIIYLVLLVYSIQTVLNPMHV